MAWSRRRKWFVLILAVLVLVAIAAMWFQSVSPLRKAFDEIRVGMTVEQFGETLERCGGIKGRQFARTERSSMQPALGLGTVVYEGAGGDMLTLHWKGPP